jgi:hypothetical protein
MSYTDIKEINSRTIGMSPDDIERAKHDPSNEVYEYENKPLEPWQRIDARTAHTMANDIRIAYVNLRNREPSWGDPRIRAHLGAQNKAWASFGEHSHTTMFLALTDRASTDEKIATMRYIARVRMQVDIGTITEEDAQAHLQEYLLEKCSVKTN